MFAKHVSAAIAATALLATVASAQTPTTAADHANNASTVSEATFHGDWRASKLVGQDRFNPDLVISQKVRDDDVLRVALQVRAQ